MNIPLNYVWDLIQRKQKELEELKSAYKTLKKYSSDPSISEESIPDINVRLTGNKKKKKSKDIILDAFKDGKVKRGIDLFEIYKKESGKLNAQYSSFSASLSPLVGKYLKKYSRENVSMADKYWYGKPDFFDGDELLLKHKAW